jgi:hypothetical protein
LTIDYLEPQPQPFRSPLYALTFCLVTFVFCLKKPQPQPQPQLRPNLKEQREAKNNQSRSELNAK